MIHHALLGKIRRARRFDDFVYPYYGGYSIAEVVPSLLHLFGIKQNRPLLGEEIMSNKVLQKKKKLFLLVDGFGYHHYLKYYKQQPFFNALAERGNVYPLTSVFPSTTSAALTALHTGLTPQEHGIPEWIVYFEEVDSIIQTLPFKTWEVNEPDGLLKLGARPEILYSGPTIYQELREHHIPSYMFIYYTYPNSVYSNAVHKGSTVVPYINNHDLTDKLLKALQEQQGPAYYFVYWNMVDSVAHKFGPDSTEHVHAIEDFASLIQGAFLDKLPKEAAEDVVLLLSADHGHVNIKQEDIINLNKYPLLEENFLKSKNGYRIIPTGSPHDVFLFIQPEKRDEIVTFLRNELVGRAEVLTTEQAMELGLFGINTPSEKFLRRIGNVIILPYRGFHVWYEFFPDGPFSMYGIHGGLSEPEMIVPFAVAPLGDLLAKG